MARCLVTEVTRNDLATVGGAQRPQDRAGGRVADEADAAVPEYRHHAARVEAERLVVRAAVVCAPGALGRATAWLGKVVHPSHPAGAAGRLIRTGKAIRHVRLRPAVVTPK